MNFEHFVQLVVGHHDSDTTLARELQCVFDQVYHDLLQSHNVTDQDVRKDSIWLFGENTALELWVCFKVLWVHSFVCDISTLHLRLWLKHRHYEVQSIFCRVELDLLRLELFRLDQFDVKYVIN